MFSQVAFLRLNNDIRYLRIQYTFLTYISGDTVEKPIRRKHPIHGVTMIIYRQLLMQDKLTRQLDLYVFIIQMAAAVARVVGFKM